MAISHDGRYKPMRPATRPVAHPRPAQSDEFMALLVRTLSKYRGLRGDLTRTAAALGIHRSTDRYRLYRIGQLIGVDPEDPRSIEPLRDITGLHP
jgi:sugar diacid utilization regulator